MYIRTLSVYPYHDHSWATICMWKVHITEDKAKEEGPGQPVGDATQAVLGKTTVIGGNAGVRTYHGSKSLAECWSPIPCQPEVEGTGLADKSLQRVSDTPRNPTESA